MRNPLFLVTLAVWCCTNVVLGDAKAPGIDRSARDITFIATSDCHYDAFENEDRNDRNRVTIREMNGITNVSWPEQLDGGPVQKHRGVLVSIRLFQKILERIGRLKPVPIVSG